MMGGYGYGYGPGMMGGGSLLGLILMALFWLVVVAGVIVLAVWLVRSATHHGAPGSAAPTQPAHDEATAIARRRLAAGEITPEQFEEIRRALDGR